MRALYTAATGMRAQEQNVEVISNNIANMRTTGFKRQRAQFQDLLYVDMRRVGTPTSEAGTRVPTGIQMGSGVKLAATARVMSQGSVSPTEKDLDMAIRGEGFYQVELPDGRTGYTRDGGFERDAQGQLVTVDGLLIQPGIIIPELAQSISVSAQGVVTVREPGRDGETVLGQVELARFVNKAGLEAIGDNMFVETEASGTPQLGNPGDAGFGNLLQGYLEEANVNPVTEIADLIAAQRAYEMNSRTVKASDEMLAATANLR